MDKAYNIMASVGAAYLAYLLADNGALIAMLTAALFSGYAEIIKTILNRAQNYEDKNI